MLTRKTLKRINERPRQVSRLPLAAIGAGSVTLAALFFVLTSSVLVALVLLAAGVAGVLVAYRVQMARAVTSLTYANLRDEAKARFSAVQKACEALSSAAMIWSLRGPLAQRTRKTGGASPPPAREPAQVGLLETPGIRADVPIWGIEAGEVKVFFFPEAVLVYRDERYEGVSYESLQVSLSSESFYERDTVPEDAQVIAERTSRSRMPVILYAIVETRSPAGLDIRLQVSSREAAARFARTFGVEEIKEEPGETAREHASEREKAGRARAYFDSLTMKEKARIASAYTTLGVKKGTPMSEITAAYKKLARVHHPDKVAKLKPEEREVSERRMKEINAAYTELKLLMRNLS